MSLLIVCVLLFFCVLLLMFGIVFCIWHMRTNDDLTAYNDTSNSLYWRAAVTKPNIFFGTSISRWKLRLYTCYLFAYDIFTLEWMRMPFGWVQLNSDTLTQRARSNRADTYIHTYIWGTIEILGFCCVKCVRRNSYWRFASKMKWWFLCLMQGTKTARSLFSCVYGFRHKKQCYWHGMEWGSCSLCTENTLYDHIAAKQNSISSGAS